MKKRIVRLGEITVQDRKIIDPASSEAARRSYLGLEQIDSGSGKIISHQSASEEGKSTDLSFAAEADAIAALERNGFVRYADDAEMQAFISPPKPPFHPGNHPNGKIYSSGRFWA